MRIRVFIKYSILMSSVLLFVACQQIKVSTETLEPPQITNGRPDLRFIPGTGQTVSITAPDEGVCIYYTLNGTTPVAESKSDCFQYSGPFELSDTTTVKAVAHKEGLRDSAIAETTFTLAWKTMGARLATGRMRHGCALVDGKIYIIGGEDNSTTGTILKSCEVYDIATDTIASLAHDLSTGRSRFVTAVIGKIIYVIGGSTTAIEYFDTAAPSSGWRTDALPMPYELYDATAFVHEGAIYFFGGMGGPNGNEVLKYIPSVSIETLTTTLPGWRIRIAAVEDGTNVYLIGGMGPSTNSLPDVDVFNLTDETLSTGPIDLPHPLSSPAAAFCGKIWVFGGYKTGGGNPNEIYADALNYLPSSSANQDFPMPIALHSHAAVTDGTSVYILGGSDAVGGTTSNPAEDRIYRFTP